MSGAPAPDDAFWLHEADPAVDICDPTLPVDACLNEIITQVGAHVDLSAARIVEIGAGIGRLTVPLQALYPDAHVVGTDICRRFLDIADHAAAGQTTRPLHVLAGSLDDVPQAQDADVIYTMCVFQHLDTPRKRAYIEQAARALRPGGVLVAQYVEGTAASRCMYDATIQDVREWCGLVGLEIQRVRHDLLMPRWTWVTATKRQETDR